MSDIRIGSMETYSELFKPQDKDKKGSFNSLFQDALGTVVGLQNEADNAVKGLTREGDISSAIIAMEKADMSFQVMTEVRNRLISAYEEIMRMQV
jgi:flagellar hook-basal body complex protein FliE